MAKEIIPDSSLPRKSLVDQHPRPIVESMPERAELAQLAAAEIAPPPHECVPTQIKKRGANGDESRHKSFIGNFHKGLPHDEYGEVVRSDYLKLRRILRRGRGFEGIPLGLGRPMVNPQAGLATDLEGPDPQSLRILEAPRVDSTEAAAEAVELYWMAFLRDRPFSGWEQDGGIADAAAELTGLDDLTGPRIGGHVTPQSIFRGCTAGDLAGPFVSQFLLHDIPYGTLTISQRQETVVAGRDYLTNFNRWLEVQDGKPFPKQTGEKDPRGPRYIRSMRDLARYVQLDALYEAYLNAALILLCHGAPLDPGNPYSEKKPDGLTQMGFGTFGGPHVLSLVTEVATRALKVVWYQKWFVHRRLRPEAYGGLVDLTLREKRIYELPQQILGSTAVQRVGACNRDRGDETYLLPMAFEEGSPTHPAYGAGHATVAGACVTILKAFFDDRLSLPRSLPPRIPNSEGTALDEYTGGRALTVGGELDKLAANISIGRNMAGVHWRSDYTESVKLGEKVALTILRNQRRDYHEDGWSFSLDLFDGRRVKVDRGGVRDAKGNAIELD